MYATEDSKSANWNPRTEGHFIRVSNISIVVTSSWKIIKPEGSIGDRTVQQILKISKEKNILIASGAFVEDPSQYPSVLPTDDRQFFLKNHFDTTYVIFSDHPSLIDSNRLRIHKIHYENINGYQAKIIEPKVVGYGYTGLFIDSVGLGHHKQRFTLYAEGVDSATNHEILKLIKSLKIKSCTPNCN